MFRIPRTRNPLLRALGAVVGVLVVGAVLVFGFFVAIALVTVGAAIWAFRQFSGARATPVPQRTAPPPPPAGVIEGEFTVVRDRTGARH
ncbi:MAG TPA: hypothetical protein VJ724_09310 [Tahibacter sp.]|nr:hypothetical protein [Tahibacter sp.]